MPLYDYQIWSMDLVVDELADGRRFRTLTVLDLYTRECLDIAVGRGLTGQDVVRTLERLRFDRGLPERIYCSPNEYARQRILDAANSLNLVRKSRSPQGAPFSSCDWSEETGHVKATSSACRNRERRGMDRPKGSRVQCAAPATAGGTGPGQRGLPDARF